MISAHRRRSWWASRKIWKAYLSGGIGCRRFDWAVDEHFRRKARWKYL